MTRIARVDPANPDDRDHVDNPADAPRGASMTRVITVHPAAWKVLGINVLVIGAAFIAVSIALARTTCSAAGAPMPLALGIAGLVIGNITLVLTGMWAHRDEDPQPAAEAP